MRLANLLRGATVVPAVLDPSRGWVPLAVATSGLPADLEGLIATGLDAGVRERLAECAAAASDAAIVPRADAVLTAPFRHPRIVWGIGLNYRAHAEDLGAPHPTEPASFIKGQHTIIGPDAPIVLPSQSDRVTAEAELGLIIGRTASDVDEQDALDHVSAVVCILDQTAEDILLRNPRFLTRSKNFPSFLALGGEVVTVDEVLSDRGDLDHLSVATWHNGSLHREAPVADMAFGPAELVAFHSRVFTLEPGDVISTGTPGAVAIEDGDVVECRISEVGGFATTVRRGALGGG